jgi:hypothetical protein
MGYSAWQVVCGKIQGEEANGHSLPAALLCGIVLAVHAHDSRPLSQKQHDIYQGGLARLR